jgi:hypothetical protein
MQPFSITLFATTGDPEGIRHLDKSNGPGYGVVFNAVGCAACRRGVGERSQGWFRGISPTQAAFPYPQIDI